MLVFLRKKLVFILTISVTSFFLVFMAQATVAPENKVETNSGQPLELEEENSSYKDHLVIGHPQNMARVVTVELIKRGFHPTVFVPRGWRSEAHKVFFPTESFDVFEGNVESDDKTDLNALMVAATGKKYIYLCMNFAYLDWEKLMIKVIRNVITVAQAQGATIIFPSVFYVLGQAKNAPYTEDDPLNPCSSLGKSFKQAEDALRSAAQSQVCRSIIIRHPLPFGPCFCDGLVSRVFENAAKKEHLQWIHRVDLPLQVCYVVDLVNVLIDLALKEREEDFLFFHYAGTLMPSTKRWMEIIAQKAGTAYKTKLDSKKKIFFFAPFHNDAAAGKDIFYSFEKSILLDGSKLVAYWGDDTFPLTPIDQAIEKTVAWFAKKKKHAG